MPDRRGGVVDDAQRLRQDEAVVGVVGNRIGARQVRDHGGVRVAGVHVQHVGVGDAFGAEHAACTRVLHFQDASADVEAMQIQKRLDVVAIEGQAAVEPPHGADRRGAPEVAELDPIAPLRAAAA